MKPRISLLSGDYMDEDVQKLFRKSLSSTLSHFQGKQHFDPYLALPGQHTCDVLCHLLCSP